MKIVRRHLHAFTLIELLVVLAIITLMAVFAVPALSGLMGSKGLANAAFGIGDSMQEARAYAMGNNTYVFLGIGEFDASKDPSVVPQVTGNGRLVVAAASSADGLLQMTNLATAFAPRVFENIHLPGTIATGSGLTARPVADAVINTHTISSGGTGAVVFSFPLLGQGTTKYTFDDVIVFDPQGSARWIDDWTASTNATEVRPDYIELDLQSTRGVVAPANPTDSPINYAAIQYSGLNGSVHVYR